jgi:hypothetical protein
VDCRFFDPSLPTAAAPGSPAKLAILAARASARLPSLFVAGDAVGTRKKCNDVELHRVRQSSLERKILTVISAQPIRSRDLAARLGCSWGQNFLRALTLLHRAGVLEYDQRSGWRLAEGLR